MEKDTIVKWVLVALFIGLLISIFVNIKQCSRSNELQPPVPIDTTYNTVVIDSIKYNIIQRDSIIYKIKIKIKEDEQEIITLDDSSSVKLFYKLVTGTN